MVLVVNFVLVFI